MPSKIPDLQCSFGAAVSAIVLHCVILTLALSSTSFAAGFASPPSENQTNLFLAADTPPLSLSLGSYNGLVIEDDVDDEGEARGLDIIRRAPPNGVADLANNEYQTGGVKQGDVQWWYFSMDEANSNKTNGTPTDENSSNSTRRSSRVYLSLTACSKPNLSNAGVSQTLPQLEMYVSRSESLQKPGPGKDSDKQQVITAVEGYIGVELDNEGEVFIGVAGPNSTEYTGSYTYEIAASIDALFHSFVEDEFLFFVDSDTSTALFTSDNFTTSEYKKKNESELMKMTPPFTMFANNVNDSSIDGLRRSYCALSTLAQIGKGDRSINTSMTQRGLGNKPKQQFYLSGLNRTSQYLGILARDGNSTTSGNRIIGGGGTVYKPRTFTTKTEDNCAVVYDLPFCSEVAYAVPSNPNMEMDKVRSIYDDNAAAAYKNFTYSLSQVQCNTSNETRYSLATSCEDCADAYKEWLCAVTIPRCADFSNPARFLHPRNVGQSFDNNTSPSTNKTQHTHPAYNHSRNPLIDIEIKPGPYKEILPCRDICYTLVKKCPAVLGFQCPKDQWLDWSYGKRGSQDNITCSYLGAAYSLGAGERLHRSPWLLVYTLAAAWMASVWLW